MYLFAPQLTNPLTTFTWACNEQRQYLPFRCFVWENILK